MMNNGKGSLLRSSLAVLAVFGLGVGTGILFAPQSGARTRRHLKSLIDDVTEDATEAIGDMVERGKRLVS